MLRARRRIHRGRKRYALALNLHLATERQVAEADAAVRAFGGWNAIFEALPPKDRARFAIRCIESADEAERRLAEQRRLASVPENDPQMRRDLEQMGLKLLLKQPERLEPYLAGLIAKKPSVLREALEQRTVKVLLSQWGYRRETCGVQS